MRALRTDKHSLQDFTKKANELAEGFRRALVLEGIPSAKAEEMTVEKTIELCRANARTDLVKAVLSSSSFQDHKEVVAKFVVEINNQSQEKQVLAYRAYASNNPRGRGRNNKYHNNQRGCYRKNGRSYNNQNSTNNQNRNKNNNNGFNPNKNNSQRGNYNNNGGRQSNSRQNVRYAENSDAPQRHLGVGETHSDSEH